jgi:hypothetical protein
MDAAPNRHNAGMNGLFFMFVFSSCGLLELFQPLEVVSLPTFGAKLDGL